MQEVVLDASAALAWVMPDEGLVEPVDRLITAAERGEVRLMAPGLWPYEVASGLRRAVRMGRTEPARAWHSLQELLSLEVALSHHEVPVEAGWWIAQYHGISLYDASYLALAEAKGCHCLTADRRLLNAAASTGLVRWIGDYE